MKNKIGSKKSGYTGKKDCHYLQFGDVIFYRWLCKIGLTPNKTKTIKDLKIPNKFFFNFLRGHFDGDGSCYGYWDTRWDSSFMFCLKFYSASEKHILWIRSKLENLLGLKGDLTKSGKTPMYQLKFAKKEAKILISKMYYRKDLPYLKRKYKKLRQLLNTDLAEQNRTQALNGRVL